MNYIGKRCRSRAQRIRLLDGAKRAKMHCDRRLRSADVAIVGCRQTGRKTISSRFGAMNEGPFEEVETHYFYRAHFDLDDRNTNGTGDLFLTFFVIPPPSDLPEPLPDFYSQPLSNFSVMIFLCSVIEIATFEVIVNGLTEIGIHELPHFLIVGNKKDLNRETFPHHFTQDHVLRTLQELVVNYYECSAKQNIDVAPILEEILEQIIVEQP